MLEHKCNECENTWHDNETDTHCPECFESDYTTEPVEVNYEVEGYLSCYPDTDEA